LIYKNSNSKFKKVKNSLKVEKVCPHSAHSHFFNSVNYHIKDEKNVVQYGYRVANICLKGTVSQDWGGLLMVETDKMNFFCVAGARLFLNLTTFL